MSNYNTTYLGQWQITYLPKAHTCRKYDWEFVHRDYCPEADREMFGVAESYEEAIELINETMKEW